MAMLPDFFSRQRTPHGRTWFLTPALIAVLPRPAPGGKSFWDLLICCPRSCSALASFSCLLLQALRWPSQAQRGLAHCLPDRPFATPLRLFSLPPRRVRHLSLRPFPLSPPES